jgi:hypothetical protein
MALLIKGVRMSNYRLQKIGATGSPIEGNSVYFEVTNNLEPINLDDLKLWAEDCLDFSVTESVRCSFIDPSWNLKAVLVLKSRGV